jgi:hypothetical protein
MFAMPLVPSRQPIRQRGADWLGEAFQDNFTNILK